MLSGWFPFGETVSWLSFVVRVVIATAISAVIGIERERKNRPAGMRTHVLVCLGACLIAMVEQQMVAEVVTLGNSQINVSMGRLTSAVVSGVGFLGAGTIILADHRITGLTTAASLWCTACIGLAIGAGYELMALLLGVTVLGVLKLMQKVVHVHPYKRIEVQFIHRNETLAFINQYFAEMKIQVIDVDFHSETRASGGNLYTNIYTLAMPSRASYTEIMGHLMEHSNIRTVRTRNV